MLRRSFCLLGLCTLTLTACGGGSAPAAPASGTTAILFGLTGTFSNLSGAKVIDLKATLPPGMTPVLAVNSPRELEIGVNGLFGLPPAAISFGRYSATTRQIVLQAAAQNIATDTITGTFARLAYTASRSPAFGAISTTLQVFGPGGANLTHRVTSTTVTPTTY